MRTQPWFFSRPRLWGLLGGLTLAIVQFFTGAGLGIAQAGAGSRIATPTIAFESQNSRRTNKIQPDYLLL